MIEARIVEVMVVVEVGDVVPNNEPLKIKWRSKASEVEDEAIEEDSHPDVETTRTSNVTTVKKFGHYASDRWHKTEDLTR